MLECRKLSSKAINFSASQYTPLFLTNRGVYLFGLKKRSNMPRRKKYNIPLCGISIQKGIHDLLFKIAEEENLTIKETMDEILWQYLNKSTECLKCETYSELVKKTEAFIAQYKITPDDAVPFIQGSRGKKNDHMAVVIRREYSDKINNLVDVAGSKGYIFDKEILVQEAIIQFFVRPKKYCYKCSAFLEKKHAVKMQREIIFSQELNKK